MQDLKDMNLVVFVSHHSKGVIMKLVIDRFEGDYAVCEKENREMINILKLELPPEVKEGSVLIFDNGKFTIDINDTNNLESEIDSLMSDIWEK